MAERFKDQVVIVTGGGRGIGRAVALEFAAEGAVLLLGGRRMDALQTSVLECREAGGRAESIKCDVAVEEDLQGIVLRAMDHYGRIDVLVNNAGVVTGGRLDEIAAEDVRRITDVNIWAPVRLSQIALPHMRAAKSGTIVNISSIAGRVGMPYHATYCASKYALRGFSEALRRELRRDGVHVMAVYPGVTATDLLEGVEIDGLGVPIATAAQVGRAVRRGVERGQNDVFIGLGESMFAGWNDMAPWAVDMGVDLMRERFLRAVQRQRTT
ncbi:MAG: SDR family oxidoreductase [Chloroflexota bacterium]|nr:SDR family oxidoreductase [Chloroflexota bacterium]